jgi:hypothetical protein
MSLKAERWLAPSRVDKSDTPERPRRERLAEKLIRDAGIVDGFLSWVDDLNGQPLAELKQEQVFASLDQEVRQALSQIPARAVEKAETYLKLNDERNRLQGDDLIMTDAAVEAHDLSPGEHAETHSLIAIQNQMFELGIDDDPDALLARNIITWGQGVRMAWLEVAKYDFNKVEALRDFNHHLKVEHSEESGNGELLLRDAHITFTPLAIIFTVPPGRANHPNLERLKGAYLVGTPFIYRDVTSRSGTVAHELGHRLSYLSGMADYSKVSKKILAQAKDLQEMKSKGNEAGAELAREQLKIFLRRGAFDLLREELVAEANSKRRAHMAEYPDLPTSRAFTESIQFKSSWMTAEYDALDFYGRLFTYDLMPEFRRMGESELVEAAEEAIDWIKAKFLRLKTALNACYLAAEYSGWDDEARFVSSLIAVTPVRLMHRLPEVLESRYGQEAMLEAKMAAQFDDLLERRAQLSEWNALMKKAEAESVEAQEILAMLLNQIDQPTAVKLIKVWDLTTLQQLLSKFKEKSHWPAAAVDVNSADSFIFKLASVIIQDVIYRAAHNDEEPGGFVEVVLSHPVLLAEFERCLVDRFVSGDIMKDIIIDRVYTRRHIFTEWAIAQLAAELGLTDRYRELAEASDIKLEA